MPENQTTDDEALHALANLYRKRDGDMRTCKHYPDTTCSARHCYLLGCQRANDILKADTWPR